ncbi:MAG: class II aldolase/adducin family protein [Acetobacteraceae bacterium]|nr:class II aldolase/adducin family protein [Acetobacteraceae bacterium]
MRDALVAAYRGLGRAGLIHGNSGNISVRSAAGMLISPSGTTPERITPESLVEMGLDAAVPGASSEWALHAAIYGERPEIGAVVHTHSDACTALACLGEGLPAFHYGMAGFGGDVRCAPYVTFGTPELAELTVAAIRGRLACLLANHGMVTAGKDLATAVFNAETLERMCRQYLLARAAGSVRILSAEEMRAAQDRYKTYGKPSRSSSRRLRAGVAD